MSCRQLMTIMRSYEIDKAFNRDKGGQAGFQRRGPDPRREDSWPWFSLHWVWYSHEWDGNSLCRLNPIIGVLKWNYYGCGEHNRSASVTFPAMHYEASKRATNFIQGGGQNQTD